MDRRAFTIAVGKSIYFRMALALARSYLRWHPSGSPGFTLVTDRPISARPSDLEQVEWVEIGTEEFGTGFTPKLYLDRLAPAARSMFIDADCLCVRSLEAAFASFAGHTVSVIGKKISDGEWFGDVQKIAERLGVSSLPRFNGGVYYIERGPKATAVYDTARSLLPRYDELGFVRLRGKENDEVLIAAAMALHGQEPIPEDGKVMNTLLAAPGGIEIDTLQGRAILRNPRNHPKHNAWYELEEMRPALVHFLGGDIADHPYRTEIAALERAARGWPDTYARSYAWVASELPWHTTNLVKQCGRPLYRRLFGYRAIRANVR